MSKTLPTFLAMLTLVACGSEAESLPPPPEAAAKPVPAPGSGEKAPTGSSSPDHPKEEPATASRISIRNTSASTRWMIVDFQGTPIDFKVGEPPVQLNAYGSYWCGGPKGNHNEPGAHTLRVDPGQVVNTHWGLISVTREGDCWRGTALPAGSYPTKACFYEQDPGTNIQPGKPSTTVPLSCVDTTLTVPSSGAEVVLDF